MTGMYLAFLTGAIAGACLTLAVIKLGEWLAWRTISAHVLAAIDAKGVPPPMDADDLDARTLDAMDTYLDALDRKQRARLAQRSAH